VRGRVSPTADSDGSAKREPPRLLAPGEVAGPGGTETSLRPREKWTNKTGMSGPLRDVFPAQY